MDAESSSPPRNRTVAVMKNYRIWLVAMFVVILGGMVWLLRPAPEPLFRGKPESEWIKNLKSSDDETVKEWRGYGEEGVRVLIRGLERADHPVERAYRRFYRRLPVILARYLPYAKKDWSVTRQRISGIICWLGKDARIAVPSMARALRDEDYNVRFYALTYFGWPPNADSVLSLMDEKEKQKILPGLLRVMQEGGGARLNGFAALKYFSGQKQTVVPILLTFLQDTNSQIRVSSAEALNRIDPDAAKKAGAVSVLIKILNDPNDLRAASAIAALRDFKGEPELAVPALIECLKSTNDLIACEAVWALEWAPKEFEKYADTIIPALTKAAQRKDGVEGYAKVALKRFQFEGDPAQATK